MSIPRPDGPDIDIGPRVLAAGWTFYTISTFIVGARVFTQVKFTRQFGVGDIVMLVALMFGFLQIIMQTNAHHHGWGRHFFFLTNEQRTTSMEFIFVSEPLAIMCSTLGRVSFIILMFRLFGNTKYRRWGLYFLVAEQLIVNLFTCITIFTQCSNVHSLWDPVGEPSKCWSPDVQTDTGYVQGVFNSATDLVLTILPLTIFWTLQMATKIKLGLAGLLGLSVFALAASIVKTIKLKSLGERSDYTFNTVEFFLWVLIENNLVMIASSVPLLRPLFSKVKKSALSHYGQSSSSYELGSRQQGSKAFAYANNTSKSIALASSSEENILPIQKGPLSTKGSFATDLENGVIKKEVHYQVNYETDTSVPPPPPTGKAQWDVRHSKVGQ